MKYTTLIFVLICLNLLACSMKPKAEAPLPLDAPDFNANYWVEQAVQKADWRLLATAQRLPYLPGLSPDIQTEASQLCGMRIVANTGDVLRTPTESRVRQKIEQRMARYNRSMWLKCRQVKMK